MGYIEKFRKHEEESNRKKIAKNILHLLDELILGEKKNSSRR